MDNGINCKDVLIYKRRTLTGDLFRGLSPAEPTFAGPPEVPFPLGVVSFVVDADTGRFEELAREVILTFWFTSCGWDGGEGADRFVRNLSAFRVSFKGEMFRRLGHTDDGFRLAW